MGEWIKHDGKGMPVPGETVVLVRFRDGGDEEDQGFSPSEANYWGPVGESSNWNHASPNSCDIVAYKIVAGDE